MQQREKTYFKLRQLLLSILVFCSIEGFSQKTTETKMTWDSVTEFSNENDNSKFGFAGCYTGVHNNVMLIAGGFFTSLATYGSDQTIVQRYLTTANEKGAVKSLLTNVWLTIPATILFFFVGTSLICFF